VRVRLGLGSLGPVRVKVKHGKKIRKEKNRFYLSSNPSSMIQRRKHSDKDNILTTPTAFNFLLEVFLIVILIQTKNCWNSSSDSERLDIFSSDCKVSLSTKPLLPRSLERICDGSNVVEDEKSVVGLEEICVESA